MRPFILIFQFIALSFLLSCKQAEYQYPQKSGISNQKGLPNDSLSFYYSTFEPFDSSQLDFVKDTFFQNWFSASLYAFKEPILFNSYSGRETYRFLWLRSFHLPMVFTIAKDGDKITLNTKKLDRQPLFYDQHYVGSPDSDTFYTSRGYKVLKVIDTLRYGRTQLVSLIKADRKANINYDVTKVLSDVDWEQFQKHLKEASFWNLTPYHWEGNSDGAVWIIEANTRSRYKYVIRQSPEGKLGEAGRLLVNLSGLKEEIY